MSYGTLCQIEIIVSRLSHNLSTVGDIIEDYKKNFVNKKVFDIRGREIKFEERDLYHIDVDFIRFSVQNKKRL